MAMALQSSCSAGVMAEEHTVSSIARSVSKGGPAWDEQIVPTLRKRLEAESQYISSRLSSASTQAQHPFDNTPPSSDYASPSSSQPASYLPLRDHGVKGTPTALPLPVRSRTRSTPLASSVSSAPTSQKIQDKSPSSNLQTRIPVARSRSGSNANGSSTISSSRHTSPLLGVSPPKNFEGSGIPVRALVAPRTRKASIDSIDLKKIEPQSSLKDERPPFLISQSSRDFDEERSIRRWELDTREALDIARKGHINGGAARGRPSSREEESKRQRADTLLSDNGFNAKSSSSRPERPMAERNNSAISTSSSSSVARLPRASMDTSGSGFRNGVSGIPRSSTSGSLGLGLGQPSTPINKHKGVSSTRVSSSGSKLRSKPSPHGTSSSTSTGMNSQTPRSVSLNMLASINTPPSSRLGIAAHFKPPESGFTPPRGQDWDDVVLPVVAKKMGTSAYSSSPMGTVADEESFVVEWDRDGTPLKWQKGKEIRDEDGNVSIAPTAHATFDCDRSLPKASPASSAFSPTFELSPDNPFPSTPTRQGPSSKRAIELDLLPTTTKSGDVDTAPASPAPFSSLKARGDGSSASPKRDLSPKRSVARNPSLLKSTPSTDDLKSARAGGDESVQSKSRTPVIAVEPAPLSQDHFPPHSSFPPPARPKPQDSPCVPQKQPAASAATSKMDEGVVKKGTCCIIM